jgi:hypothetical protein
MQVAMQHTSCWSRVSSTSSLSPEFHKVLLHSQPPSSHYICFSPCMLVVILGSVEIFRYGWVWSHYNTNIYKHKLYCTHIRSCTYFTFHDVIRLIIRSSVRVGALSPTGSTILPAVCSSPWTPPFMCFPSLCCLQRCCWGVFWPSVVFLYGFYSITNWLTSSVVMD